MKLAIHLLTFVQALAADRTQLVFEDLAIKHANLPSIETIEQFIGDTAQPGLGTEIDPSAALIR